MQTPKALMRNTAASCFPSTSNASQGFGYRKIAGEVGLGVGTVMRLTAATEQISRPFDGASVTAI
jgi:hypothetical protein